MTKANTIKLLLIPLVFGTAFSLAITTGHSSWVYTDDQSAALSYGATVPSWSFSESSSSAPISSGEVIIIDSSGNIIIVDGSSSQIVSDGSFDLEGGEDTYDNGDVHMTVAVDEDGNLVLTEFTATNTNYWAVIGTSEIYLPTAVTVGGETYPITGISEPLDISGRQGIFFTEKMHVHIPSTYTFICAGAFKNLTSEATFEIPASITSIGAGAFMPARNVTQTINYAGTQAQWNAISKPNNYENGQGSVSVSYNQAQ